MNTLLRTIIAVSCTLGLVCSCGNRGKGISASQGDSAAIADSTSVSAIADSIPGPEVPTIRFLSKGSILPPDGKLELLFGSVSYAEAEVRIKKIFTSNILQFMQSGEYEAAYGLGKVAKQIADTTIVLGSPDAPHLREFKTYGLDLDEMIKPDPGAIYRVEIRGRKPLSEENFWDSDMYFGSYDTYRERSVNLLASNIALTAKKGDNSCEIYAFNILTGKPVYGVRIKLYDFTQQELAKGQTGKDGLAEFAANDEYRFAVATNGKSSSYLNLSNEKSLSTSSFDVGGTTNAKGIKAYIFGERGVWRPGDTLHVSAITSFDGSSLPAGHPIVAELRNPDGQVTQTLTVKSTPSGLYHFPFTTDADAPTGRWRVDLNVGGQYFSKTLRVEAVKPNKLDIDLRFDKAYITPDADCIGTVSVNWLYGAPGSGLKIDGSVELTAGTTSFADFSGYDFKDDARSFDKQTLNYAAAMTDTEGKNLINTEFSINKASAPGMLDAAFTFRAFEPSGDFSTSYSSFRLSPFDAYVGIKTTLDRDEWGNEFIKAGRQHRFDVVTVNPAGKGISRQDLLAEVYHVDWSWWWNASGSAASYMSGSSKELLFKEHLHTGKGGGSFSYDWNDAPSGLYYIKVSDIAGGHATSLLCEVNEGSSAANGSDGSTKLNMVLNKDSFKVGQVAAITIPSSKDDIALVSVEKGGNILSTGTFNCSAGATKITVPVTAEMMPNAYVFISLIQPHGSISNDAPIRLYGIRNIDVSDPSSKLSPVIDIPASVKPESKVTFKVKEASGRQMSYVVALVDEGLLSLTGFKTPDAWSAFYAKEALRVRTWDQYDDVIGAYGGKIEQLFAIGGDDEASGPLKRKGADRFTPVVRYLGPFDLKAGHTATHSVLIPQYIGTLRAMVTATDGKAQGSASKDVAVTKDMMVQATLPRTLSVGETIQVPATLIALKDGAGKVKLSIKADGPVSVSGASSKTVSLSKAGQEVEYFEVKVGDKTGKAHISVTAESATDKSVSKITIDVLNPNPEVTRLKSALLAAGESKSIGTELFGIANSNSLVLELSSIPPVNLGGRLKTLLDYPYGCLEQTISAAFPQLYLDKLMDCDEHVRTRSTRNVTAAIGKLPNFRHGNGALGYWQGSSEVSAFGTVYALHFLQEAENQGYAVPSELKNSLSAFVSGSIVKDSREGDFVRAYGLYALANASRPQRAAMNLMRENVKKMGRSAVWMLAAAYACDGKKDIAVSLTNGLPYLESDTSAYQAYYGSEDRNMAIALKTALLTGQKETAFNLASKLAAHLNDGGRYMSTQATAWSLYAMSGYAASISSEGIKATVKAGGKSYKVESAKAMADLPISSGADAGTVSVTVSNGGNAPLHAVLSATGIPKAGGEKQFASGLEMTAKYIGPEGAEVNVAQLDRGSTFYSLVTITNTGASTVKDLALAQKFPSGWEIRNDRLYRTDYSYPAGISYQDFRDDRVYSFFDLEAGKSISIRIGLTATYPGTFYLPAISCEAMYDASVSAILPGRTVAVK